MTIFNKDRIGKSVFCRLMKGDCPKRSTVTAYVRWTHAITGLVVSNVESMGRGKLTGPWIVQDVDVPTTANSEALVEFGF